MKKYIRTIVLLVLTTGCLLVPSIASTNMAYTYVARTNRINEESQATSRFFFALQTEDSLRVEILDSIKLKDPDIALFYAVVPGFIIHGAGHFYAAKTKTGVILLASGVVGGTLFTLGALDESLSHLEGAHSSNSISADGLMAIGAIIFVGSWVYDVIGAPLAVQKYNDELLRKKNVGLKFDFNDTTNLLRFQIVKRF